jgi:hypothetical protein
MATEYLNDGATSFAAANWATIAGVGGSGFANGATLVVPGGSNSVTGDLDWTALTTGIATLKIAEPFSGNIGTAASPLYVDVTDGSAAEWRSDNNEGRLRHDGSGSLFFRSDATAVDNFWQYGAGRSYLINGTVTYLRVQRGTFQAEAASTVTNAVLMGGSATFLTKTAAGTLLNVYAGSHVIQRPFTTINVYGGTLLVNVYNAAGASTINQYGGTVILYGHGNTAVTAYNHLGGALDWSKLRVDTTITTYTRQFGATVSGRPNGAALTLTNSYQRDENIGPV